MRAEAIGEGMYDVTWPLRVGIPVWPGDTPCSLLWTMLRSEGASVNVAELRMSAHTGTHADGPFHVDDEGIRIGAAPLDAYLGPATVVDVTERGRIDTGVVEEILRTGPAERVLFRTGCWTDPDVFPTRFPAPEPEAARALVRAGVRLVGTDAPSVDPFDSRELETHRVLGAGGVAILENLLLAGVPEDRYELIALPLRLVDADASPVRAVLRRL
ncbi:MAG TPA: cyclase family protein [Longimicrobiaceae bacterium]|nr:cyclase family protein [Longimicrobiaceae bacterium]